MISGSADITSPPMINLMTEKTPISEFREILRNYKARDFNKIWVGRQSTERPRQRGETKDPDVESNCENVYPLE